MKIYASYFVLLLLKAVRYNYFCSACDITSNLVSWFSLLHQKQWNELFRNKKYHKHECRNFDFFSRKLNAWIVFT